MSHLKLLKPLKEEEIGCQIDRQQLKTLFQKINKTIDLNKIDKGKASLRSAKSLSKIVKLINKFKRDAAREEKRRYLPKYE